ncbi:MAG TPA: hypothetical protein VGM90_13380 [Kofleriaceae bacterium]|jgi:hypothetical protein
MRKPPPFETDDDNLVKQEQAKGEVRPDGPGDETAPVGQQTPKAPRIKEKPVRRP